MKPEDFYLYAKIRWKNVNTRRQYELLAKRLELFWENGELTQNSVNNFMASIVANDSYGNPIYNSFVRNYLSCYEEDLKVLNRTIKLVKPTSHVRQDKKYKFLSQKEIWYLIKFIGNKYLKICVRAYSETGLRCSELINMNGSDIDLDKRTFTGIGKGNKEFVVPFSNGLKIWIQDWLKQCHNPDKPFLIYRNNGKSNIPLKNQMFGMWYLVKTECEHLGLLGIHPHRFRHYLGHMLSDKGWRLNEIQVVLRHSNIQTTQLYAPTIKTDIDKKLRTNIFKEDE